MVRDIENLIEITDFLEQKIRAAEDISWDNIQHALNCITEEKNKGLYGLTCYYAAFYMMDKGRMDECLCYLNESIRCIKGTEQEREMARCHNLLGVVAHSQNNLILAMEHYEKALIYAGRYNSRVAHTMVRVNMANTYYRVGAYDRAMVCYKEGIHFLTKNGRTTTSLENLYRRALADYGCCLLMMDQIEKAVSVAEELKQLTADNKELPAVKLGIYIFFAFLYSRCGDTERAEKYTDKAVQSVREGCTIYSYFDNILNLIQFLLQAGKLDSLRWVLDCMEPQAAIEQNESFLLQLLLYRLQYCSDEMDQRNFLSCAQTFFSLKNKHEFAENNQVLHAITLRNKLRKIEEEQTRLVEQNSKLLYQTNHDELSGLYNKRYLNRRMEEMFEEALQKELTLGVLFADIDYFKQMNDRYGHQKGDNCIVAISKAIKACMPEDFAARYGGDEFVIITLGKSRKYLEERAQSLIDTIKAREIPNADSKSQKIVTITIGAVHAIPHKPNKMWDFLTAADETLYQQKNEQRGCVRFYCGRQENSL